MTAPTRPRPVLDALSRPFWEGARDGQLTIQRCSDCGYFRHPPRPLCERCASEASEFVPVSGRGRVFSFTTNYQRNVSGFEEAVPYVNLIVELDEQPGLYLLGDIPADEAAWVAIDVPVEVVFEPFEDASGEPTALPQFRPAEQP
jgi:uncharacterized OB-fold protein